MQIRANQRRKAYTDEMCFIWGREKRYGTLHYKALPSLEQALLTTFHSCKAGTYSHINRRFPVLLFTYACGDLYVFCCMWNRFLSCFITLIHTEVNYTWQQKRKQRQRKKRRKRCIYSQSYFESKYTWTKAYFLHSCETKCLKILLYSRACSYFIWASASRKAMSCCKEEGRQRANCIQQLQVLQHSSRTWLYWPPIGCLQQALSSWCS